MNLIRQAVIVQRSQSNAVVLEKLWKLSYHYKKCKHLYVEIHDINYQYITETDREQIVAEKVTPKKDLEVIMDASLKFTDHINRKVNKANRNMDIHIHGHREVFKPL